MEEGSKCQNPKGQRSKGSKPSYIGEGTLELRYAIMILQNHGKNQ
jgi:hypothetical protein